MADVKYYKLPIDFFETKNAILLEDMEHGDEILLIYLKLLGMARKRNDKNLVYIVKGKPIDYHGLSAILHKPIETVEKAIRILTEIDALEFTDMGLKIKQFWLTNTEIRNSQEYREWRREVFERDNFTCQKCGQHGGKLEAHHIKGFAAYPALRFIVSNGVTLCKQCHKDLHQGGRDNNGSV
ncbi:phage replisome organizer N-terminal domain-containing protein [Brevibacillus laterosporus]|uniref:phage replisome organizer N-terminal domain-containing protein n=1 Tax=Brevibacillus laterosporus TaxID=1465 RepID=UPI003D2505A8